MDNEKTFDEMKVSYQKHIDQIIDFNEDDYDLVNAVQGKELNKASKNEIYYYLRKGRVKQ